MLKKLSLLLLMCLFTSTMFAQESVAQVGQQYFTVKGLELKPGLTMDEALNHFLARGFKKAEFFYETKRDLDIYVLKGSFFNTSNCTVRIVATENDKNIVKRISIEFPERDTFKSLKEEYDDLKFSLSNKYYMFGCTEKFDNDYVEKGNSDLLKLHAIERGEAKFESLFILSNKESSAEKGLVGLDICIINGVRSITLQYNTPDSYKEYLKKSDDL